MQSKEVLQEKKEMERVREKEKIYLLISFYCDSNLRYTLNQVEITLEQVEEQQRARRDDDSRTKNKRRSEQGREKIID